MYGLYVLCELSSIPCHSLKVKLLLLFILFRLYVCFMLLYRVIYFATQYVSTTAMNRFELIYNFVFRTGLHLSDIANYSGCTWIVSDKTM